MSAFEAAFGIPAGHTLCAVQSTTQTRGPPRGIREWEHEEHDEHGVLVAVYVSWTLGADDLGTPGIGAMVCWVKYSPYGWVLRRVGAPPIGRVSGGGVVWLEAA
jgi:hypothetical protein